jgi:hypothetical protein
MTSYTQIINGTIGRFLFSILVLTSDDCAFAHGVSDTIPETGDVAGFTRECYQKVKSQLTGDIKLAFLYIPFTTTQCTHKFLEALAETDPDVPVFGSLAANKITHMVGGTYTLCDKDSHADRLTFLLVSGGITPEFHIGSAAEQAVVLSNVGEVTASRDNYVMEINHMNINRVLEKTGYKDGAMQDSGAATSVFIVNEKDEAGNLIPVTVRGMFTLTDEYGVFGGRVQEGSVLSIAINTKESIIENTRETIAKIKEKYRDKTVLMYSCLGRWACLLDEPMLEMEIINETLADSGLNYAASYSGGEICPLSVTGGKADNSEHNQALIACVF